MSTFFMKLGYTERVLPEDGFYSVLLNGTKVGFNIDLNLNYYRGLALSCVEKLEIRIDGEEIPNHLLLLKINGKMIPANRIPDMYEEYWGIKKTAHLIIFNGGLPEGEHDVEVIMHVRNPYMQFGPGMYGGIDSSCRKTLTLGEGQELC